MQLYYPVWRVLMLVTVVTAAGSAQSYNPLTSPLSPYRLPSVADRLADAAQSLAEYNRLVKNFNREVAAARGEYWKAYPAGPELRPAAERLSHLLQAKDYYFLSLAIGDIASGGGGRPIKVLLDAVSGDVDGGISSVARRQFDRWAVDIANRLLEGRRGLDGVAMMSEKLNRNPQAGWAEIHKSDALYEQYTELRDMEEYRRAGKMPEGFPEEAWRLAVVGAKYVAREARGPENPYREALEIVSKGGGVKRRCEQRINSIFGPSTPASACGCLQKVFSGLTFESDLWKLETDFSDERLLATMLLEIGMKDKAASCLK